MKISGACSRSKPQKNINIFFKKNYGKKKLKYKIFKDQKIKKYKHLILRAFGNDWNETMIADAFMQESLKGKMDIDRLAYVHSIVFLNGFYWGIHNIREKANHHYIASHHKDVGKDNIDLLKGTTAIHYKEMIKFLTNNDMNSDEGFSFINKNIDINEFLNYYIAQIYFANPDWPGNNVKIWRSRKDGKFRRTLYDLDVAYGLHHLSSVDHNTLEHATTANGKSPRPNPPESTLVVRKLLENEKIKNEFIQRFMFHLGSTFPEKE